MKTPSERIGGFLAPNLLQWEKGRQAAQNPDGTSRHFTVALSREDGTEGTAVAQEVARRLGWLVYDRELLEEIAKEMGIRTSLLESVDEKRLGWLTESIQDFLSVPRVNANAFIRHLIQTVLALGVHGECVIVGRGASFVLPVETTLRVRLVAPLDHRIAVKSQQLGISREEATAQIERAERDRMKFVHDLFLKDNTDPRFYDLALNTSIFSVAECADLILEALHRRQKAATLAGASKTVHTNIMRQT